MVLTKRWTRPPPLKDTDVNVALQDDTRAVRGATYHSGNGYGMLNGLKNRPDVKGVRCVHGVCLRLTVDCSNQNRRPYRSSGKENKRFHRAHGRLDAASRRRLASESRRRVPSDEQTFCVRDGYGLLVRRGGGSYVTITMQGQASARGVQEAGASECVGRGDVEWRKDAYNNGQLDDEITAGREGCFKATVLQSVKDRLWTSLKEWRAPAGQEWKPFDEHKDPPIALLIQEVAKIDRAARTYRLAAEALTRNLAFVRVFW